MNIENILNEGINILQKNEIANPQLDSEILLSSSIKKDKKHIILNPKEILNSEQLGKFKSSLGFKRICFLSLLIELDNNISLSS